MVSEREYLTRERASKGTRHELWAGRMEPTPSESWRHALMTVRVLSLCANQLTDDYLVALGLAMRVRVESPRALLYPDVVLARSWPDFVDAERDTITNPHAIVEIVSARTLEHDRGRKLRAYQALPSLEHYVLVMETSVNIEHFRRQSPREWDRAVYGAGDTVRLDTVEVTLPSSVVYAWR